MARTVEEILRDQIGLLFMQLATLIAKVEEQNEKIARLDARLIKEPKDGL